MRRRAAYPSPMSRTARLALTSALALGLALGLAAAPLTTSTAYDARSAAVCAGSGPIQAADLERGVPCDVTGRVVVSGAARVVVPPAGQAVAASGLGAGVESTLVVDHTAGAVVARTGAPGRASVEAARADGDGCNDKAFKLYGTNHAWHETLRWSYNPQGEIDTLPSGKVLKAIKRGGKAVAQGKNACGLTPKIDAAISYEGTTSSRPDIRRVGGGATCKAGNGDNVVGWGKIGGDSVGWTCLWWDGSGAVIGADILLKPSKIFSIGVPEDCHGSLDLQSLVTHEWGHAFGLDHVSQSHDDLLMPHGVAACSVSDRTLGLGDYLGLKKLYGTR